MDAPKSDRYQFSLLELLSFVTFIAVMLGSYLTAGINGLLLVAAVWLPVEGAFLLYKIQTIRQKRPPEMD